MKLRIVGPLVDNGTISFSSAMNVFAQLKNLLSAAARSALIAKNAYAARPPREVLRYLRETKLGQTQAGSYVITVISPVDWPRKDRQQHPVPFARQAMATLALGISAAKEAAEKALRVNDISGFADVIDQGVSANLCDALVGLSQENWADNAVETHFAWSYKLPGKPPDVTALIVPRRVMATLASASDFLKTFEPEPGFQLIGYIYRIEDLKDDNHTFRLTVAAAVEGGERAVNFLVSGAEKAVATSALDDHWPVICTGTLDRRPRPYVLDNVRSFRRASTESLEAEIDEAQNDAVDAETVNAEIETIEQRNETLNFEWEP